MRRPRPLAPTALLAMATLALGAPPAGAQNGDGLRVGVTLGEIGFVGLTFEYVSERRGAELTVGTSALRDVSVSLVGKQYLGPGGVRPYFGAGLWGLIGFPEEGTGAVLVARAPVGLDWRVVEANSLGVSMNINRALWVRRTDPDDPTPLNRNLVPLPGFYYRWGP